MIRVKLPVDVQLHIKPIEQIEYEYCQLNSLLPEILKIKIPLDKQEIQEYRDLVRSIKKHILEELLNDLVDAHMEQQVLRAFLEGVKGITGCRSELEIYKYRGDKIDLFVECSGKYAEYNDILKTRGIDIDVKKRKNGWEENKNYTLSYFARQGTLTGNIPPTIKSDKYYVNCFAEDGYFWFFGAYKGSDVNSIADKSNRIPQQNMISMRDFIELISNNATIRQDLIGTPTAIQNQLSYTNQECDW